MQDCLARAAANYIELRHGIEGDRRIVGDAGDKRYDAALPCHAVLGKQPIIEALPSKAGADHGFAILLELCQGGRGQVGARALDAPHAVFPRRLESERQSLSRKSPEKMQQKSPPTPQYRPE